jgi:hypothetical protein
MSTGLPAGDVASLLDELRRAVDGVPWHGPSIHALLSDVTPELASRRPVPSAHSIWEIVLHLRAWTGEVHRRLDGGAPALPVEGDWPAVGATDAAAWGRALAELATAHGRLLEAVAALTPERLAEPVGVLEDPDAALGTETTLAGMLHGLAQHDAYHGGQIAILKRIGAAAGV